MEGMEQIAQIFRTPAQQRAFQDVQRLVPFIRQMKAQKAAAAQQQRTAPVINALSSLGQQWQTAATPEAKETAHSLADKTRSAYLTGGGSPTDLGQQYWGSDPTQGFEGTGGFSAPITGYEGLARKDTIDYTRDALAAELKRRLDEAGLTGVDPQTGQATLEGKYKNYLMSKVSGGSSGGSSGGGSAKTPTLYDQAKAAALNDPRLYMGAAADAPEGSFAQNDLIAAWMKQMGGGGGQASGGGETSAMIQQARANGYSDDEIRQGLKEDGIDPAAYGL